MPVCCCLALRVGRTLAGEPLRPSGTCLLGNYFMCRNCAVLLFCRHCGEEGHVPLKCSEVEKKGTGQQAIEFFDDDSTLKHIVHALCVDQATARLSVEEAMTEARLRECKKCKAKYV
jgi:hypothetical protein